MNLSDYTYLCLDIGTFCVRGAAVRITAGRIVKSALSEFVSDDTAFAIKSVLDSLETDIGTRFGDATITGNFGELHFNVVHGESDFGVQHKITAADTLAMITASVPDDSGVAMHIIPLRYDTNEFSNVAVPIGVTDNKMSSMSAVISYDTDGVARVRASARAAHIAANELFDSMFLVSAAHRHRDQAAMFIDLGAADTTVGIWTRRGPVFMKKINMGGAAITNAISEHFGISVADAEQVKRDNMSPIAGTVDGFTPAGIKYGFTRADVNDIAVPLFADIINSVMDMARAAIARYAPMKIYLYGGGAKTRDLDEFISSAFGLPVENLGADAAVMAAATAVWRKLSGDAARAAARADRRGRIMDKTAGAALHIFTKRKKHFIPIMPSTLSFNMADNATYSMFAAAGISMIHIDIMDGMYVANVAGSISEIAQIRAHTKSHLHVHLMTETPSSWVDNAVAAGADTIIVSTGSYGVRDAIKKIRAAGKRAGIALRPNADINILRPILREVEEILVMSVEPGAAGQDFIPSAIGRVRALAATRRRYDLKYKISVDGGINADNAAALWRAGADYLVSGSYLADAVDFPAAVMDLIKMD